MLRPIVSFNQRWMVCYTMHQTARLGSCKNPRKRVSRLVLDPTALLEVDCRPEDLIKTHLKGLLSL
jgi:hypothetical protein